MSGTQAVIFDLYETLISEYENGSRKVSRSSRDMETLIGLSDERFKREWNSRQDKRMTGHFRTYKEVMKDIAECNGMGFCEETVEALYTERILEKSAAFVQISPEIVPMLRKLKAGGLKLGLISNCTEEEVRSWGSCGLAEYFDQVVFSYEAGLAKPDERIYKRACSLLEVEAEQCVYIGDGGSDELLGASRVGMRVYQAVWFIPASIADKHGRYPRAAKPADVIRLLSC
ncbi:HAD family hydrolase [Paenibacillus sp. MBLB4367]|uniref:HAD family hydrolase n=1 Tax=Paenibacillus sp. MBLB4367 TaxID=3384767 RepID=UPI0039082DD0